MLWESDDPAAVLAERFGFADVAAAERWLSRTVEQHWEIDVVSCERVVMSFKNALAWIRTPDGPMLAKWSIAKHRFPRLSALADATAWLDQHDMPVSAPVPTPRGRRQDEVDGVSIGLQRQIHGALLDVTDPDQVHAAGATLSLLHETLSSYPDAERIPALAPASRPLAAQIGELARSAVLLGTKFHDWGPVTPEVRAGLFAGYQSVCRLVGAPRHEASHHASMTMGMIIGRRRSLPPTKPPTARRITCCN